MSAKLSKKRWQRIDSIFDEILQYPEDQQLEILKLKCDTNQSLFVEIQSLLDAEKHSPTLLDGRALDLLSTISLDKEFSNRNSHPTNYKNDRDSLIGRHIGSYRLCKEIGRGGMGLVYLAERADGAFEQTVAIKLLQSKEHHQEKISRFQREQQVLASLNHPNIAQLYDGGVTDEGVPYFVMEYVEGKRIDEYCDQLQLSINSRLRLILQIIEALSFAHKNFIIHRDIKPSNILVTNDGKIKLLDFGIAKLLSGNINVEQTQTKGLLMTLGYAAPEQLLSKPITVKTDIYQLGLVMYKLVTGIQAFQNKSSSFVELAQIVCEREPEKPSSIIENYQRYFLEGDLPLSIDEISSGRHTTAKQLKKELEGDIDCIILKALSVEEKNRYDSIDVLKSDIECYFSNRPIVAQQPTFFYQSKKFLKRHWLASSLLSIIFLLVITYAITITLQAKELKLALDRTKTEKKKALQVSDFMIDVFKASDPNVSGLENLTADIILARGHRKILDELDGAPEIQALLLTNLGEIHYSLGEFDKGVELLEDALSKQKVAGLPDELAMANTKTQLGIAYTNTNQLDSAKKMFEDSLSIYLELNNSLNDEGISGLAETNISYASLLRKYGQLAEAELYYNKAITLLEFGDGIDNAELAIALNGLAVVQIIDGFYEKASVNMLKAIDLYRKTMGENNSEYTLLLNNYSLLLIKMEKFDQATKFSEKSLEIQQKILRGDHPYLAATLRSLGKLSHYNGDLNQAEASFQKALRINRASLKKDNFVTAGLYYRLGAVYQDLSEYFEAERYFNKMIDIYKETDPGGSNVGMGVTLLASLSYTSGNLQKSKMLYQEALEMLPKNGLRTSDAQLGYALVLFELNEIQKSKKYSSFALTTRLENLPAYHSSIAEAEAVLGLALLQEDNGFDEGRKYLQSAQLVLQKSPFYQFGHKKLLMQNIAKQLSD